MQKLLLVAGLAAALAPSAAFAQTQTCEQQQRTTQALTTIAGAGVGALVGATIAPRRDRAAGALVGAAGGAIVGSQVGRPDRDCAHAYGYYDRSNQWHAVATDRTNARGYYDRDGAWVDGAPNGYYDNGGRWVAANATDAGGYYDSQGRWAPAAAGGYYDERGQWVASASGHYQDGRWVQDHGAGAYDVNGRWIAGAASGHTDASGIWVADAQTGYWDSNHRWRSGAVRGYYDTRGGWVGVTPNAGVYGADTSYGDHGRRDVDTRTAWLQQRIDSAAADGSLNRYDARQDRRQLTSIRNDAAYMRSRDGQLAPRDEGRLQTRLDALSASLKASVNGAGF